MRFVALGCHLLESAPLKKGARGVEDGVEEETTWRNDPARNSQVTLRLANMEVENP